MVDNVGQQRLHAAEQRVRPAREEPPVATRVEAAQEGRSEAKRSVLAASISTREASVASDADVVDEEQMGGEKPVLLIGSPMCQTFCDLIMVMWNAHAVGEVKYENSWRRCASRPEEEGMYGIQRIAGGLFLHENPWDRWSREPSFAKEVCFPKGGSCCKLRSRCVTEKLSMCCCSKDGQTESSVMNSDECTKGVRRVLDSITVVGLTRDCCENRDRRRSFSWTFWMCAVNVRGSGHQVFLSLQRNEWTKVVPSNLSTSRDCVRKNSND